MRALYLFSIWLHVVAAAVWIGGTIFLAAVLVPMIRRPEFRAQAPALLHWAGQRFRRVGYASLLVLIVTGLINLEFRRFGWLDFESARGWASPFGGLLAWKLLLVLAILVLSGLHDVVIGPRAMDVWRANPASPEAQRLRGQASWIGRINLLLSLLVVALGVMLVRGRP